MPLAINLLFVTIGLALAAAIVSAIVGLISRRSSTAEAGHAPAPPPRRGVSLLAVQSALTGAIAEVCALVQPTAPFAALDFFGVLLAALAAVFGAVALDRIIRGSGRVWGEAFAAYGTISFLFVILLSTPQYAAAILLGTPIPRAWNVPVAAVTVAGGLIWGTLDVAVSRRRAGIAGEMPGVAEAGRPLESKPEETLQEWLAAQTREAEGEMGAVEHEPAAKPTKPPGGPLRLSDVAVASLGCGVLSYALFPVALPALIAGVAAVIQIAVSRGRLWGTGFALAGILFAAYTYALLALSGK